MIDGEVVFSEEIPWDPSRHDDPLWHYDQIMDSLRRAAEHLPRVDAIGGSAAGVYVDSQHPRRLALPGRAARGLQGNTCPACSAR